MPARRFGSDPTTRRSHGKVASGGTDPSAAWQPRNPIGSLSPNPPLVTSKVQSAGRPGTRTSRCAIPARASRSATTRLVGSSSGPTALTSSPPSAAAKPAPIPPRSSCQESPLTTRRQGGGPPGSGRDRATTPIGPGQSPGISTMIRDPIGSINVSPSPNSQRPSTL